MKKNTHNTVKNTLVTFVLATIALAALLGSGVIVFSPPGFLVGKTESEKEIITKLQGRTIIDFSERGDIVVYSYRAERLPERLADDEDPRKRTTRSYTRDLGQDKQGAQIFNTVFYIKDRFVKDGGDWYFVKYDRAPRELFYREYIADKSILSLFSKRAHADTFDSGAGDGLVEELESTWDASHDSTSGFLVSTTSSTAVIVMSQHTVLKTVNQYQIQRGFLPFDTSAIPGSATIQDASLTVRVTAKSDGDNDGDDFVTVVQTDQATHTDLALADFDNCGAVNNPTEGIDSGERKDITNITTSADLTFALNSTGQGWIAKSGESSNCSSTNGITCLGLREGHDVIDSPIASNTSNTITIEMSEGTNAPSLSVTYGSFVPWQFFPF